MIWLEAFALVNLAGLAPDIYLAHSTNLFRVSVEYLPLYFSLAAPVILIVALIALRGGSEKTWRVLGHAVGWCSVVVGVAGLILHLDSHFFHETTLASLVYTAPFAAPLAYTGIGLILILNRMVDAESPEWPQAVLLLALGGFVGNFIFSLTDHAQNGFFREVEWVPVVAGAVGVGFLLVPFVMPVDRYYLASCAVVMAFQAAVGLLGFYFHVEANLASSGGTLMDKFVYGAPALAPLLFPNLALLAGIGLFVLHRHLPPVQAPAMEAVATTASPLPGAERGDTAAVS
jgi:hypothetical protein